MNMAPVSSFQEACLSLACQHFPTRYELLLLIIKLLDAEASEHRFECY